ncbi:hypothetical protein BDW68DRAFT_175145 [Aspergillus falconensis]
MEINLVIVEAKRRGAAEADIPQLLGYMSIAHLLREKMGKAKKTIYGVSTDSIRIPFLLY